MRARDDRRGDGGSIVNVASIWGLVGVGQIPEAGYAASKGGLVNLTRELAAQWARKGVRVNCLAPGWFRTEMTEGTMFGDERAENAGCASARRWAAAATSTSSTARCCSSPSDASSFVTGQVLCVDGGWTAI